MIDWNAIEEAIVNWLREKIIDAWNLLVQIILTLIKILATVGEWIIETIRH